jgi:hypothetical protein
MQVDVPQLLLAVASASDSAEQQRLLQDERVRDPLRAFVDARNRVRQLSARDGAEQECMQAALAGFEAYEQLKDTFDAAAGGAAAASLPRAITDMAPDLVCLPAAAYQTLLKCQGEVDLLKSREEKSQAELVSCQAKCQEALKKLCAEKNEQMNQQREEMHRELVEEMDLTQGTFLDWSAAQVQKAKAELESLRADKDNTISLLRASLRDVRERYRKKSKIQREEKRLR